MANTSRCRRCIIRCAQWKTNGLCMRCFRDMRGEAFGGDRLRGKTRVLTFGAKHTVRQSSPHMGPKAIAAAQPARLRTLPIVHQVIRTFPAPVPGTIAYALLGSRHFSQAGY